MTDKVTVIQCRGGLNEELADTELNAGNVTRSSNYEQVAEGGYRRVEGSTRWGGTDMAPDIDRLAVILVTNPYGTSIPGVVYSFNFSVDASVGEVSGVKHRRILLLSRGTQAILLTEKEAPTNEFEVGEEAVSGGGTGPGTVVLQINPELTEDEEAKIINHLDVFAPDNAAQPNGDGDIHLLHGLESQLICARRSGADVFFQKSFATTNTGSWLSIGSKAVPDTDESVWSAITHQFYPRRAEIYVCTGTTNALRLDTQNIGVTDIVVPSVSQSPRYCIAHQNHLFLAYAGGRVIHSDLGDPTTYSAIGGAAEFATGSEITGMQILPGASLAIFGTDRISILNGTSTADWQLQTHTTQIGAIHGSLQNMPTAIFASKRGITTLSASDNYGDFGDNTLSHAFDPTYQNIIKNSKIFTLINREKSQYRIINEHGIGLFLTFSANALVGAMEVDLKHDITAVGTIDGDEEKLFFATPDGYVHKMDFGGTWSGRGMEPFIEFPFYHHRSPQQKKRFKSLVIDVQGDPRTRLAVTSVVDMASQFHNEPERIEAHNDTRERHTHGRERLSKFHERYRSTAYLTGTGIDHSIRINPVNTGSHEIESMTVMYTYRGQKR